MSHSYVSCLMHVVFSTKGRLDTIAPEFRERLWRYIGGIARANGMEAIAVGGTANHAHVLTVVPAVVPVAKAVQLLKGGSSKWVHETFPAHKAFSWQEGYGAFSVGISGIEDTKRYIAEQEEHHKMRTFQDEFIAFLKKNKVPYDERYVWG